MSKALIGIVIALLATHVGIEEQAAQQLALVSGRTVEFGTGAPVSGATVKLAPQDGLRKPLMATTNSRGDYVFTSVPTGAYRLTASAVDCAPAEFGRQRPEMTTGPRPYRILELGAGDNFRSPDLILFPFGSISGTVKDEFQDGVPDVAVRLLRPLYEWRAAVAPSGPGPAIVAVTTTDDRGRFRLGSLPEGLYYLQVLSDLAGGTKAPGGFAPTYFPGTTDVSAALPLQVQGRAITNADLNLVPAPTTAIKGTVVDLDGQPANSGSVVMVADATSPVGLLTARTVVSRDGAFVFRNVPIGTYSLRASGPIDSEGYPSAAATLIHEASRQGSQDISIFLRPLRSIRGRVRFEERPLVSPTPSDVTIQARSTSWNQGQPLGGGFGKISDDWTFSIGKLTGPVVLVASVAAAEQWVVRRIEIGGHDVTDLPQDLRDRDIDGAEVFLSNRATLLTGTSSDEGGRTVTDYCVVAFVEDNSKWTIWSRHIRSACSNHRGSFEIAGLPQGLYNVVAVPFLPGDEWDRSTWLREMQRFATQIFLTDGSSAAVSLTLRTPR